MAKPCIELKGASFTLSVLHLKHSNLELIATELAQKIAQAPQFFLGAPLVVNLSAIHDDQFDIAALKRLMSAHNLVMVGVSGASKILSAKVKALGLANIKAGKDIKAPLISRGSKIIKRNIRSGQQIYAPNSDVIVFGNVGNGAEVIADGSIHVYGALRGKAMAGASGDKRSVIIAQVLEAELVSIAGQYWLNENLNEHDFATSGCIRLNGESLIVESLPRTITSWQTKG
ncbi:putative septum site-determining protein MinC [Shewanella sp. NFH-SH190041]|uniref:septum site-determining protein MinC n=1 Tax=Shewanella sp. NFH-SH190041 TaxID=2950245 RepID=UPI0021C34D0B|nr:septum site-determining protein MinC [Shewanella sp. NFH-SH190041]BDM64815.1 putative septum site-determining protein MinC [Shewanella sp. NFH-SH190041]